MSNVIEQLRPLIAEAREKNLWIHCQYEDLWFSPDQLEQNNSEGRFLWGADNWTLRDPQEKLARLKEDISIAEKEYAQFNKMLAEQEAVDTPREQSQK